MFPCGEELEELEELRRGSMRAGGTTGLLMDLAANKEAVHASSGFFSYLLS
uniref:Uncharacterized protein n=1 Tax=Haplochromis burtoni TaxID=8153 RepID=A0A3Q3CSD4_HAPBU